MDDLTAAHAANTLVALGAFGRAGERNSVEELIARHAIKPAYARLLRRWLALLVERDALREDGAFFIADRALEHWDVTEHWRNAERALADDPDILEYAQRASGQLVELITGQVSALDLLFGHADVEVAAGIYERRAAARYLNGIVAACVRAIAEQRTGTPPFRLLEAGAGTGGTTSALVSFFPDDGEYWFTDVSEGFLGPGERKFGGRRAFRFAKFDLEQPAPPEFPFGSCDVVLAANVVHATRNVATTLQRLKQLLKPDGVLVLLETTAHQSIFDMTIGFIDGWSAFSDGRTEHPLLDADRWVALARECGFAQAERFPRAGSPADYVGQHVIVARNDGAVEPRAATPFEARSVFAPAAAALPAAPQRLQTFAAECVAYVLHAGEHARPGLRERFSDLGMDSLMALQLKATLGSQLGIADRIASTIAFDTGTVEALAEQVLALLDAPAGTPPLVTAPAARPSPANNEMLTAAALAERTDAEVEALLAQRLGVDFDRDGAR